MTIDGSRRLTARSAERSGAYALPVGNGEAEAVGVGDPVGATEGTGDATGWVAVAEGSVWGAVGVGVAEAVAHPLSLVGVATGVPVPPFPLVGAADGLAVATGSDVALAVATGSGVAQDGEVGLAVAVAVGADGTADALAWAGFLLACTAPVPAVAADAQPASSATPATVPTAQAAVTCVLRVVTFICSSS
jgi:hypothetical protein